MSNPTEKILYEDFISDLFRKSSHQILRSSGPLAKKDENPTETEITKFATSEEAISLTKLYLCDINNLWLKCKQESKNVEQKISLEFSQQGSMLLNMNPLTNAQQNNTQEQDTQLSNAVIDRTSVAGGDINTSIVAAIPETLLPHSATPSSIGVVSAKQIANIPLELNIPIALTPPPAPAPMVISETKVAVSSSNIFRPGQIPIAGIVVNKSKSVEVIFHIPNAKAGQPYIGRLEGKDATGRNLKILKVELDPNLGLKFDDQSGELKGVPASAGEHTINIRWTYGDSVIQTGECYLIINPDPRSLWKNIEPPADDLYFKPNTDNAYLETPRFQIAAASRRGRSHEHTGSSRDDDFFISNDSQSGWSTLIVADGAGSAKNSRYGSKLAVEAVGKYVKSMLDGDFGQKMSEALEGWSLDMMATRKEMSDSFFRLFYAASRCAVQAIEDEAKTRSALPKDYSTTLLVAVIKRNGEETFVVTFWMGDGAIAVYGPRGKVRLMGTPDGGEFAGQTRFLDSAALRDPNFGKRVSLGQFRDLKSIILMTDGVSDPIFETDNGLSNASKWDALWDELAPSLKVSNPSEELVEWLHFFEPGHHDDRTIALLWYSECTSE